MLQGFPDPIPVVVDGFTSYSRFGFTVSNIGDVNSDGYEGTTLTLHT